MKNQKNISKEPLRQDLSVFIYAAVFAVAIIFFESILRIEISGTINSQSLTFLIFVPAEAFFFSAFVGFHRKHRLVNKIIGTLLLLLLGIYYCVQLVYFRIFGSLISISMLGMGTEAVGNFGWAMDGVITGSIGFIIILLMPAIIFAVFSFVRPLSRLIRCGNALGYRIWMHPLCLVLSVLLWFAGIGGLRLMGNDRQSAYYVLCNSLSDTDTTSERIGALSTTVVEGGAFYFGISLPEDGSSTVATVDNDALNLEEDSQLSADLDAGDADEASAYTGTVSTASDDADTSKYDESESQAAALADSTASQASTDDETAASDTDDIEIRPYVNDSINFNDLKSKTSDSTISSLCDYFGSKQTTATNEYTGIFEGYNLIYICAESFNQFALDEDVTPTLYKMAHEGIVLTNYYNSFKNTTTNGEFAFTTSYWPDVSRVADSGTAVGSFPQSANIFMPYGLGDFFDSIGVPTYAYHDYFGDYYKRKYSWPNIGYENIKFMGDGMTFSSQWPASDMEMIEQSIDDYISDDQFHAYYMTFSGHGPYTTDNTMYRENIDKVTKLVGDKYTDSDTLGYLCGEYELEKAMNCLLTRLEAAGKLDNTVIVIGGDHFPYFLTETAREEFNGGEPLDEAFEQYHSSCIIYNAGLSEPIVSDTYCCNVDILPTILNLFGIDYDSRLLMGTDIFSNGIHRARLYNGSFITDYVRYNKKTGETTWSDAASKFSDAQLDSYLNAMINYTESEYSASLKVLQSNFFLYVWENSGLLSDDEIQAEKDRESEITAIYEREAQEEAEKEAEESGEDGDEGQTDGNVDAGDAAGTGQ